MKEHNTLVKFKNSFIKNMSDKQKLSSIISDDIQTEVSSKMSDIYAIYKSNTAEHGYSINLAYRVILLSLMTPQEKNLNVKEQIFRFFKYCLQNDSQLENIRFAFDILILKQINSVMMVQELRLIKVKMLRSLKEYYFRAKDKKQMKKCSYTMQEYCKETLRLIQVKRNNQIYCEILDIFIELMKDKISSYMKRRQEVKAVEKLTSFIGIIQKNQYIISKKYQIELMQGYFALAIIHHRLHYAAYTKKYAAIALNIAERTQSHHYVGQIKDLIEKVS